MMPREFGRCLFIGITFLSVLGLGGLKAAGRESAVMSDEALSQDGEDMDNQEFDDFDVTNEGPPPPTLRAGRGGDRQMTDFKEPLPILPDESDDKDRQPFSGTKTFGSGPSKASLTSRSAAEIGKQRKPKVNKVESDFSRDDAGDGWDAEGESDGTEVSAETFPKKGKKDKAEMAPHFDWGNIDLHSLVARKGY